MAEAKLIEYTFETYIPGISRSIVQAPNVSTSVVSLALFDPVNYLLAAMAPAIFNKGANVGCCVLLCLRPLGII